MAERMAVICTTNTEIIAIIMLTQVTGTATM
jgi:hypothetical protein